MSFERSDFGSAVPRKHGLNWFIPCGQLVMVSSAYSISEEQRVVVKGNDS